MTLFGLALFAVLTLLLWWALQNQLEAGEPIVAHAHEEHAEPAVPKAVDDLTKIEGIGPKISELLKNDDISSFADLAAAEEPRLQKILDDAGSRYQMHEPDTWPEQAQLAANGKWDELEKLQEELQGGRED
ncbi:MAG: hypothetical protein DWQ07_06895 [Chloroflexi bacterium]|nr:MAG: hypothetical protein DWQ07_06895 [Chloroflexota bacterium]MBL1195572.1 hypothetical protein [Chloroflexota bacterium]NOH12855.1 hypothetical protein [Chloroflexota bacterium]